MLTLYRRHLKDCPHSAERFYKRCKGCPCWVQGIDPRTSRRIRQSLQTSSWERAERIIRAWQQPERVPEHQTRPKDILEAFHAFYKELQRRIQPSTLRKYRYLEEHLTRFCNRRGLGSLDRFTVEAVREFRTTWKDSARSANKKLERLRAFFNFCLENEWIARNPAKLIRPDRIKERPTLPFSEEEMRKILEHAGDVRLFILAMRYTGMRISDVALLKSESIASNRLFLYMAKTDFPVYVPIPEWLASEFSKIVPRGGYLFLRGESTKLETCADLWRRQLAKVFKKAKVDKGHPHRFRDTFAVELLKAGVPIEEVSVLLGHRDIKITQRHYAPWGKARQERLEELVRRTWSEQPTLVRVK